MADKKTIQDGSGEVINKRFYTMDKLFDPAVPSVTQVRSPFGYISWGVDNLYPNFIIEMWSKSSINRACITAKTEGVIGQGLETVDEAQNYLLDFANPDESWNDVWRKCVQDFIIFGGFAAHVIWNNAGTEIAELYHLDFSTVRSGGYDAIYDAVRYYYVSHDWTRVRRPEYKPKPYHKFDTEMAQEAPSQIFYFFEHSPAAKFYPNVEWLSGGSDIMSDIELSAHHSSNLKQGLFPGMIINLNGGGNVGPTERQMIYNDISNLYTGGSNAGKFLLSINEGKDAETTVTPIPPTGDNYLLSLEERLSSRICTAHRVTNTKLVGFYETSKGGLKNVTKDELIIDFELWKTQVLIPYTKCLLKQFNRLFKGMYGESAGQLQVEPMKLFADLDQNLAVLPGDQDPTGPKSGISDAPISIVDMPKSNQTANKGEGVKDNTVITAK